LRQIGVCPNGNRFELALETSTTARATQNRSIDGPVTQSHPQKTTSAKTKLRLNPLLWEYASG